jgi:hypothetical protein
MNSMERPAAVGGGGEVGGAGIGGGFEGVFIVDGGGFEVGHPDEAPAGGGHGFDESFFAGGGGGEFGVKRCDEGLEARGTLALEDVAFGEKQ